MVKKILIAEDEEFIANLYKLNLDKHGVEVVIANDGRQAMEMMKKINPELILLDLLMPDMDGFQVLRQMKEEGIEIPVVILTNLSQEIDKQKCQEMGAKDFFVKSDISVDELWEQIKQYL